MLKVRNLTFYRSIHCDIKAFLMTLYDVNTVLHSLYFTPSKGEKENYEIQMTNISKNKASPS